MIENDLASNSDTEKKSSLQDFQKQTSQVEKDWSKYIFFFCMYVTLKVLWVQNKAGKGYVP